MILPPFEFLVNCGKVTFILYEVIQNTFLDLEDNIVSNSYIGINLFNYSILILLFSLKYEYYF